ncbi:MULTISPECIES: glycoside hydrolase family 6 protein [unclassified Streptomyces]|uniref:glycoside hydrolase family 6 protein n=1 Tax=unclassified Streptomyces TaxID=2593676 RepID=UPI000749EDDA|nr:MULTISPECIES: glycoside hydrolase family 6 protein [unclassified Streptomyces]KUL68914.1 endoglucanase [Streptomyces sp. NRRL WC-3604]KUL70772.1 endoglucanase [Streptomyces sp. NRRL WC-3605]
MVAAASVVVAVGTTTGLISALDGGPDPARAGPSEKTRSVRLDALPVAPSASPSPTASLSASASPSPRRTASATPTKTPERTPRAASVSTRLYRHPDSQVQEWVRDHPGDPRHAVIQARIAAQPAAVWFADFTPGTITARVRAVTSAGAAQNRTPVVVPYVIPDRDCGGYSEGGAPDLAAYDAWIDRFAAGLGSGDVVVVLEPDSVAQSECLSEGERAARFASLARAGRVIKSADPRARVYYDAGHSGWHSPATQAGWLRQAGAASSASSDGVFSNVSNFHTTAAEIAYDQRVLDALGGGPGLGAVIDTSRNGAGAPPDGEWCDPSGRKLGRAPTLATGEARIDGYLWVKLPGESDGCKGEPGSFTASYAYELAR